MARPKKSETVTVVVEYLHLRQPEIRLTRRDINQELVGKTVAKAIQLLRNKRRLIRVVSYKYSNPTSYLFLRDLTL